MLRGRSWMNIASAKGYVFVVYFPQKAFEGAKVVPLFIRFMTSAGAIWTDQRTVIIR